jgi:tetratricopeptide (TPR) repeat protein
LKRVWIARHPRLKVIARVSIILLLLGLASPQAWAWYQLRAANSALGHYHPEEARKSLTSCLAVWSHSKSVHLLMSRAARQDGDLEAALQELRIAQRLSGEATSETAFEWALLQASAGNVREVDDYLQKQVTQNPEKGPLVWEALVEGYLTVYDNQDAMICIDLWLKQRPDDVRALELRGRTLVAGRGISNGAKEYRRVLALDPTRKKTRWRLIESLINLGSYEEAAQHLELFARDEPDSPEIASRLARCYIVLNRRDESRQLLDRMLEKYPENGLCLRVRGQFALTESPESEAAAEAERYLRKAAAILPEDYQTQFLLFESLRRQGKSQEAHEQHLIVEAVKERSEHLSELRSRKLTEQPLDPALHYEMGMLLSRTGHADAGEAWFLNAVRLDPNHKPAHAALADHYEKIGNKTLAAQHRAKSEE